MIVATSLLVISLIVMAGMIQLKLVESRTGRQYLFFNEKSDRLVAENFDRLKKIQQRWNLHFFRSIYNSFLDIFEGWMLRLYRYLRQKFDKPVNLVKGQGSPYSGDKPDNDNLPK